MDKTGWQVTAGILAITSVGLALGVVANKAALAEANRMLTEARQAKMPATETLTVIQREPCPGEAMPASDGDTECRGGVLLRKTSEGWESVTVNGQAITCRGRYP